jgi:hypothetical protein
MPRHLVRADFPELAVGIEQDVLGTCENRHSMTLRCDRGGAPGGYTHKRDRKG